MAPVAPVALAAEPAAVKGAEPAAAKGAEPAALDVGSVVMKDAAVRHVRARSLAAASAVRRAAAAIVVRHAAPHGDLIVVVTVVRVVRVRAATARVRLAPTRHAVSLATVRRRNVPRRAVNGHRVVSSSPAHRVRVLTRAAPTVAMAVATTVGRAAAVVRRCRFVVVPRETDPA